MFCLRNFDLTSGLEKPVKPDPTTKMDDIFKMLHQWAEASTDRPKMTARQFLGKEEGVEGYTTPADCLRYFKSLSLSDGDALRRFFEHVRNMLRCENHMRVRTDRGERPYRYPRFILANAVDGTKVIAESGMDRFVDDYAAGKVSIDFSLKELIEELQKD